MYMLNVIVWTIIFYNVKYHPENVYLVVSQDHVGVWSIGLEVHFSF
jgi:hypothetical protein